MITSIDTLDWCSRTIDAALAVILADGTRREWLYREYVVGPNGRKESETRIMQTLRPALGACAPGVCRARVWIEFDPKTLRITQNYEGPDLRICVEHTDSTGAGRRMYDNLDAAVTEIARATHEPAADVRLALAGGNSFRLEADVWRIVKPTAEDLK